MKISDVIKKELKVFWGKEPNDDCIKLTPVIKTNNLSYEGTINYDLITYRNIDSSKINDNYLVEGDLLIEKSGGTKTHSVGYVNYFNGRNNFYVANNFILALRPNKKLILPKYLFYNMKFYYESGFFSDCFNKTTGIQNLKKEKYLSKSIIVPSFEKQQIIVNILDKIYDVIKYKNKELLYLNDLVKSQFIEMFGEIGKDEKGWGFTTLGKCCELNPKRPKDIDDTIRVSFVPMLAVSDNGKIDCSEIKPYRDVRKGFTYFAENDVIFAKITPCMENGKGAIARGLAGGIGSGSTEFHILRPIIGKSNPYWLYVITKFTRFRDGAKKVMTGTGGQLRVPIGFLRDYPVSLPPIELQNEFERFVQQIDKSKYFGNGIP